MAFFEQLGIYLNMPFARYALITGTLTALCAALIGVPLVLKRVSFIGDGLSHVAFGGIAIAAVINLANDLYIVMPLTVLASILLLGRGRKAKVKGDAVLAMLSVGSLAVGYFIMNVFSAASTGATGSVAGNIAGDVCTSLFGATKILTVTQGELWACVVMSAIVLILFLVFYNRIFATTFDAEFLQAAGVKVRVYEIVSAAVVGVVVALSMRLVGSLLTAALIIFPAVSAMRVFNNFKTVVLCSALTGVLCALTGIFVSMFLETPAGATIVVVNVLLFAVFCGAGLLRRKKA